MIPEIDEALFALLRAHAVPDTGVEVAFDPPTRDWAARRNMPTVNAYLYDIREDVTRRQYGSVSVRNELGIVTERRRPVRYFRHSYLVTCWTSKPKDEHRLLASVLSALLGTELLPITGTGVLATLGLPVRLSVAVPLEESRSLTDIWSALGGELRPSLDVVITAPYPTTTSEPAAPPVTEAAGVVGTRMDVPDTADQLRLRRVTR